MTVIINITITIARVASANPNLENLMLSKLAIENFIYNLNNTHIRIDKKKHTFEKKRMI